MWQTGLPKKNGYYWVKDPGNPHPVVVMMDNHYENTWFMYIAGNEWPDEVQASIDHYGDEFKWQGPLEPDENMIYYTVPDDLVDAAFYLFRCFASGDQDAIAIAQNELFEALKELDADRAQRTFLEGTKC